MRIFVFFAIIVLMVGGSVPRLLATINATPKEQGPANVMAARPEIAPTTYNSSRSLTVRRDQRGHFHVEGRIDGRRMDFLVDTGASIIAIPESEAARLGIHPARSEYTARIRTANGAIQAAPTRLNMVEIGSGLVVRDVAAVVMPDGALSENLLGMSFLSRLRRFEVADGKLVLEQ
jgi:aspartyl protease family protein